MRNSRGLEEEEAFWAFAATCGGPWSRWTFTEGPEACGEDPCWSRFSWQGPYVGTQRLCRVGAQANWELCDSPQQRPVWSRAAAPPGLSTVH